jgi:tetratricopeptide (TPR) repeat protein
VLFDLKTGKRRRVVQVLFGSLAFIFFISFVGFGIGSDATGGIFDAIGLGGSDSSSTDPQFEEQIDDAEAQVAADPKDEKALLELAEVRYQAGQFELEADPETGAAVLTEESRTQFEASLDAWERYLDLKPDKPDPGVAALVAQAYVQLNDAEGAAAAQEIVAEDNPSAGTYGNLALYRYAAGDIEGGDEAAELAVQEAEPAQRKSIRTQLTRLSEQAQAIQEQQEKAAKQAETQGEEAPAPTDPFGELGGLGGTGGVGGTAPTAPAP